MPEPAVVRAPLPEPTPAPASRREPSWKDELRLRFIDSLSVTRAVREHRDALRG